MRTENQKKQQINYKEEVCRMKKMSTLFVILFAAMAVCGCGSTGEKAGFVSAKGTEK